MFSWKLDRKTVTKYKLSWVRLKLSFHENNDTMKVKMKELEKMKYDAGEYDIAVVGAGHAGCEAALAAARMGMKTLLFSISLEAVANMPCNPHIGGS